MERVVVARPRLCASAEQMSTRLPTATIASTLTGLLVIEPSLGRTVKRRAALRTDLSSKPGTLVVLKCTLRADQRVSRAFCSGHSLRNATIGSIEAARRAGR